MKGCPVLRAFRQKRAILHLLIVLFAAGHIGSAARTCVLSTCFTRLKVLIAFAAAGALVSLIVSACLFANIHAVGKYEWIIDLILIPIWAAAVGLTMYVIELFTPLASPLIAFAWLGLSLVVIATMAALFGWDGPLAVSGMPYHASHPNHAETDAPMQPPPNHDEESAPYVPTASI